ncbi:MAG: DNA-binding NtrC family response regulator [Myxococcota bacterium]|jgi:DNA-binding NtrC family response regulator
MGSQMDSTAIGDGVTDEGPSRRLSLMVYHRDGVEIVPLVAGEPVVIGRAAPSTLMPRSRRLSRQHARFALEDGEVVVTDLRSTNGTFVNGEQFEGSRLLSVGDEVQMGSVAVSLHRLADVDTRGGQLESHERFVQRVEGELVRARVAMRPVSVLMVRAADRDVRPATWFDRVRKVLRMDDRVALYAPDTVEILLSGIGRRGAGRLAESLAAESDGPNLFVGVAVYPVSGNTSEALVESVRAALLRASKHRPVQVHEPVIVEDGDVEHEDGPVIRDARMVSLYESIERIARSNIAVLLLGETGTGKEVLARSIHERSQRTGGPMRVINCGAIPANLIESVLFGHERGAFTGADRQTRGVFEESHNGTLLLDEIGELSPAAQVALLRVLETKRLTRVGSNKEIPVDVRVLAATHRDLEAMCEGGEFRWDLLYRLNTMTLEIPPLRERVPDIRPLAMRFIRHANAANDRAVRGLTPDAMMLLETYHWPGNVRELKNCMDRAVVIAHGQVVTVEDLPSRLRSYADEARSQAAATVDMSAGPAWPFETGGSMDMKRRVEQFELALIQGALRACHSNQTGAASLLRIPRRTLVYKLRAHRDTIGEGVPNLPIIDTVDGELDFRERVERFEAKLIQEALQRSGGSRTRAAALLEIQKRTLDQKLRRYGIE